MSDGDPRAARTRAKLRAVLLAECRERSLEQVSVAAVARRAGVSRSAFYLHYTDAQALAVGYACADVVRDAVAALHAGRGTAEPAHPPAALTEFFDAIAPHAALDQALLRPGGSGPLGELLRQELRERSRRERTLAGAPSADLVASAVAATFAGILADWLHGEIEGTFAQVAAQTWRLPVSLHRTVLER
ncbi:TetR/AcrR family transcriptional regulator [Nocardia sp. NBC_00881]|uniref:TetR/AcrR family transcriptional regulator n=1 Tax=Nocardia sp. NBC_00881 TaxID=2975995 RepID=UPI00386B903A|nr:TetR/AcrR family transcriptional regulator [Nocardia sp. NBC_00881]